MQTPQHRQVWNPGPEVTSRILSVAGQGTDVFISVLNQHEPYNLNGHSCQLLTKNLS